MAVRRGRSRSPRLRRPASIPTKTYTAVVTTNMGAYTVHSTPAHAPITVNNFVVLARYHYFDSTICHRAIPGFMVQCGDPTGTGTGGPGYTVRRRTTGGRLLQGRFDRHGQLGPRTNGSQFFIITGAQGVALTPTTPCSVRSPTASTPR